MMKKKINLSLLFIVGVLFIQKTKFYFPCLFQKLTNFYCPGCGITRMILSILKFDFYQAFRYNPLVFLLFITFFPLKLLLRNVSKKSKEYASYLLLFVVIFYGILRNVEFFSYLKPTIVH